MERRSFLSGISALIGGIALEKAIPFNRVWSFPKNIVIAKPITITTADVFNIKLIPADLTLCIDDFAERYVVPAIKGLAESAEILYGYHPTLISSKILTGN